MVAQLLKKFPLQHKTQQERTQPTNTIIRMERIYIFNNRRQQFPRPVILTPDDDHIGRNM
jgi:hypothetical protein